MSRCSARPAALPRLLPAVPVFRVHDLRNRIRSLHALTAVKHYPCPEHVVVVDIFQHVVLQVSAWLERQLVRQILPSGVCAAAHKKSARSTTLPPLRLRRAAVPRSRQTRKTHAGCPRPLRASRTAVARPCSFWLARRSSSLPPRASSPCSASGLSAAVPPRASVAADHIFQLLTHHPHRRALFRLLALNGGNGFLNHAHFPCTSFPAACYNGGEENLLSCVFFFVAVDRCHRSAAFFMRSRPHGHSGMALLALVRRSGTYSGQRTTR